MKIVSKKSIFILLLLVICLGGFVLRSTYAKFTSSYTTDEDIVSYRYVFDLDIENIDEYELISVSADSDYIFNIDITNSLDSTINYGVWYGMVSPESEENITVAKLSNSANSTSDKIDSGETKTVSLIIQNETSSAIQVKVGVTNLSGKKIITKEVDLQPKLSQYIENLYEDGSGITSVNIGGDTSKPKVNLNSNQGIMLDNNGVYRYYGSTPNNYVLYNDELWRIISVSYIEDTDGLLEKRVKIIRTDSIGGYSWDSSDSLVNSGYGVNDWSEADLMTELNTLYYNRESGICYNGYENASTTCDFTSIGLSEESRNLIGGALYYLGGTEEIYELYADDYYNFERGKNLSIWTGLVGLVYPSDYMYATDLSVCTKVGYSSSGSDYDYRDVACYGNDWLYKNDGSYWTISPSYYNNSSYSAHYLNPNGFVSASYVGPVNGIRPVVYLKSNVVVSSGKGTTDEPYILDLF